MIMLRYDMNIKRILKKPRLIVRDEKQGARIKHAHAHSYVPSSHRLYLRRINFGAFCFQFFPADVVRRIEPYYYFRHLYIGPAESKMHALPFCI